MDTHVHTNTLNILTAAAAAAAAALEIVDDTVGVVIEGVDVTLEIDTPAVVTPTILGTAVRVLAGTLWDISKQWECYWYTHTHTHTHTHTQ